MKNLFCIFRLIERKILATHTVICIYASLLQVGSLHIIWGHIFWICIHNFVFLWISFLKNFFVSLDFLKEKICATRTMALSEWLQRPLYWGQYHFQTCYKKPDKKSEFFKISFFMFSSKDRSFKKIYKTFFHLQY